MLGTINMASDNAAKLPLLKKNSNDSNQWQFRSLIVYKSLVFNSAGTTSVDSVKAAIRKWKETENQDAH
jgi:hypothetical protein